MAFPARLPIPDPVVKIAMKLESAGYETWCVGGAVRDNLLGLENHDFDLTTAAPPAEIRRLFQRTVPVGIEHGTIAVLDRANQAHEVTTFRKDIRTDGRHAVVEFGVSLMDDLARRDFTINAIAYHPIRHAWQDPFKGAEDLEKRLIRSVGDPNWRFQEDYLRILRALRFSARFDFRIHPRTLEGAKANVQGLAQLSAERVMSGGRGFRRRGGCRSSWPCGSRSGRCGSGCPSCATRPRAAMGRLWTSCRATRCSSRRFWHAIPRRCSRASSARTKISSAVARSVSGATNIPIRPTCRPCGAGSPPPARMPTTC
jgi:hypothetical protein